MGTPAVHLSIRTSPFFENALPAASRGTSLRRQRNVFAGIVALLLLFAAVAASAQGAGYWHTSGNLILDANNAQVRIAGINWYGFETTDAVPHGLTSQDYKAVLDGIKKQGYNTVRIPLSNQMVETPGTNLNISFYNSTGPINTDLRGLNSMQVLDKIVIAAGNAGLKVILDNHRSEAGNSAEANGLWFTAAYPESAWIADWVMLAKRYQYNTTVIGFDLRNEPHNATSGGACWDCGGANDWHLAAARAGNAVLDVNAKLLIFVEGTDAYENDFYWWGGNLEGVAKSPVTLSVANQLVYSAHEYGPKEYQQTWFNGSTSYASLSAVWNKHWAYISQNNLAPVWIGEFGTTNNAADLQSTTSGSQGQWFQSLVNFMTNDKSLHWTYWALNGEDSYGLLNSQYEATPVSALKQSMLSVIQSPFGSGGVTVTYPPAAPSAMVANTISSSQINLAWTASATAGSYYTLYFGTAPGSVTTVLASGITATSYPATGLNASTTYYFRVVAVGSGGTSGLSNQASATTMAVAAPLAPVGLLANAVSTSQINLAWSPSAGSGVTYNVYSGAGNALLASGVSATTFTVTGLSPNTAYTFTVAAVGAGGTSAFSNTAGATTQTTPAPDAPSGLSANAVSTTEVQLQWSPNNGGGVTYSVFNGSSLLAAGLGSTSYRVGGLTPGTAYGFTVKAVGASGTSAASNIATATTQAAQAVPPTSVTATAVSATQINLAWDAAAVSGVEYNVYVGTSSGATNTLLASSVAGTGYQASELTGSTTYFFTLRAVSAAGTSSSSNQASATTFSLAAPVVPGPAQPTAPVAPAGLSATAVSPSQINLSWNASSTSGATYALYGGAGGPNAVIASGLVGTGYAVTGLTASTAYSFTVVAQSQGVSSAASNTASATTQAAAAPSAPSGLTATAASSTVITLTWAASASSGVSYNVYSAGALLAGNVSGTSYSATGLTANTAYSFTVKAVSGTLVSAASNVASATTQTSAASGCHVSYAAFTDWGAGFTAGISITNNTSADIHGWLLTWTFGGNQQLSQSWNGDYTQAGKTVSLANAAWNGTIARGATIDGIGFNAAYTGSNASPATFYLNGVACK